MAIIKNNYIISQQQTGNWILEISGKYFTINSETKELINILSAAITYKEATETFNLIFKNEDITENEFIYLIEEIFLEIPILRNSEKVKKSKSFIRFQKELLTPDKAGRIAEYISFLFQKRSFWITFTCLSSLAVFLLFSTSLSSIENFSSIWIFLPYGLTIFLHEIGHISACKRFTGKNGEIGLGIYIIFPVLYSNISAIWHSHKEERIITNLAGVYMQFWCMLFFYILYLLSQDALFLLLSYFTAFYCVLQIFPFIRSDGYWLLSDISSTSNLLEKSGIEIKSFIKKPIEWIKKQHKKKIFLLCYGLFNIIIIMLFIITQVLFSWKQIIYFPVATINIIWQISTFQFTKISIPDHSITSIIFYIILLNSISSFIKKYLESV
ncbi:hypothetical protein IQ37_19125 [Chryseobacterium piperi]|uniref:Peptidase M50 n=1 Tax=Chryseobacterium piperi TaxID=558152 RepID=A0A086AAJ3_9FLAO|nr:hypothetical protein [Chryseobacterium piperi]ASW75508.1 hypothetical protein CJF12_15280 [Chryseobacterium piperi]KFF13707.1 hypothetical protein IQ37_19125 [Chryseobacterium piperi]